MASNNHSEQPEQQQRQLVHFRLTRETRRALKMRAAAEDCEMGDVIESALKHYIAHVPVQVRTKVRVA